MAQTLVNPADGGTGQGLNTAADNIEQLDLEPQDEEVEETEEPTAESETATDDAGPDEPGEDDEETVELKTLSDVAEAFGVESDDLMDVEIPFKADGEEQQLSLKEIIQGYQKDANYRRQTQELAQKRQALETDYQEKSQTLDASYQMVGAWMGQVKNLVLGQLNTPEMQELRSKNPAEWTARQTDGQRLAQALDGMFNQVTSAYGQHRQQQQQLTEKQMQERLQAEMGRITEYVPDWSNDAQAQTSNYLMQEWGFSPDELQMVDDARHVAIARKAYLYDQMKAMEGKTKKTVRKVQKTLGKGKPSMPAKKKHLSAAKARHAKNKNLRSGADVISQLNLDALE